MKELLEKLLHEALGENRGEVVPEEREGFGHYTTAIAMQLAKERKEKPLIVAEDLLRKLNTAAPEGLFERLEVAGPGFINMWLTPRAQQDAFEKVAKDKDFGKNDSGKEQRIIVEFSSQNIAKVMHVGHLRNNVLGEALARIHKENGWEVVRWNYLGDWGTQFGKIIAAYKLWKDEVDLAHDPISKIEELYVRFNEEAKKDETLASRGAEEFKKLESGDEENRKLWNELRTMTLTELEGIYRRLDIRFDEYIGESFFEDKMEPYVKDLLEKGMAEFSEGALIVKLEQFGLPPALIKKSDGASLYLTRDIAALAYRVQNYHPARLFYVIGNEQTLQFQQLFAIAGMLGLDHGVELHHVKYGLLLTKEGGKMSTREGTSVAAVAVMKEALERAGKIVREKNPDLSEDEVKEIAEKVGIGALKYFMLRESRTSDIRFDWEKILDFKGDSGPYLQYTYARLRKLLAKAAEAGMHPSTNAEDLGTEPELRLIRKVFQFPYETRKSANDVMVNNLTKYLYELANLMNRFYEDEHILTDENASRRSARLFLAATTSHLLQRGLGLLGIEVSEKI